jgi:hypothetical protein
VEYTDLALDLLVELKKNEETLSCRISDNTKVKEGKLTVNNSKILSWIANKLATGKLTNMLKD